MWDEEYIGETSRTFGERSKEHLKEPSPIYENSNISGHSTNHDNFTIIGREDHGLTRTIKKSIYIRVSNPTLNRNVGKYNLDHIWDRVLFSTPEHRSSNDDRHAHRTPISWHAQSIPTNRHALRIIGHTGHAQTSEHVHRHLRINIRCSKSAFPSDLMKSSSCLHESLTTIPTGGLLRESFDY